jgi:N-succinyldiaminopimelate aminotransferase
MAGATRVPVTLRPPDFRPDLDALRAAITGRTRLILVNTPHNPTGAVFSPDEVARIAELACEHGLLVVSDEVYEHMVYDGIHVPIVSLPGMSERTVTISSAAKMFGFTGWKVGWVTGSPELVTAVRTVKQFLTYVTGGPFQYAVAEALALPDDYYAAISADLRVKRDFVCAGLAGAGFEVYRPAGTYFITTDVRPLGYADGMEFCRELPRKVGVVAIPSVVFYDNTGAGRSQVRFAFCKKQHVLAEALSRLVRAGRGEASLGD